jgi:hypothetical protein
MFLPWTLSQGVESRVDHHYQGQLSTSEYSADKETRGYVILSLSPEYTISILLTLHLFLQISKQSYKH